MEKNIKVKNKNTKTKKNKNKKIKYIKFILLFLLIFILFIIGIFIYKTQKNGGGTSGMIMTAMGQTQEDIKNLDPISVLLLGSSQNMTDTIMVLKYNPQNQKAYLISIPRDTFIGQSKNTAKASDKINCLYQGKHPEKTLAAVNKVTGLNLDYYVIVDTEALKALVDAIGGVYFDVPIDMKYTDKKQDLHINLQQGYQLLDGNKAEQVVRFRHNQDGSSYSFEYGDNDIGRMKTQRNFLKAVMKQTLTADNIINLGKIIDIAQTYVKTNLPVDIIKQYIAPAVNFDTDNLETGSLPGVPEKCNGVWLYIANKLKTQEYFNEMSRKLANIEEISEEELSNLKIEVLNGSGKTSSLTNAKKILKDAGFNITKTGNTNSTAKTSIINKSETGENILSSIKDLLEIGTISDSDTKSTESTSTVDITIILGKDFNKK